MTLDRWEHTECRRDRLDVRTEHERHLARQRQDTMRRHDYLIGEGTISIDAEPQRLLAALAAGAHARTAVRERDHRDRRSAYPACELVTDDPTRRHRDRAICDREITPTHACKRNIDHDLVRPSCTRR